VMLVSFAQDMFPGVRPNTSAFGRRTMASCGFGARWRSNCSELKLGLVGYLAFRMRLKKTRDDPGADRLLRVELRDVVAVCGHPPNQLWFRSPCS
jgi:hypothetical protein